MKRILLSTVLFLTACASGMTQQQESLLHEMADRPVTCKTGDDCEKKWNRAIEWVSIHTHKGVRTVEDNLISTNMVKTGDKPPQKYPEFNVVRYAISKHLYRMDFTSYCDYGFPCNPSALKLRASFVTSVMGPPPGVIVAPDGRSASKVAQ